MNKEIGRKGRFDIILGKSGAVLNNDAMFVGDCIHSSAGRLYVRGATVAATTYGKRSRSYVECYVTQVVRIRLGTHPGRAAGKE
jgi:hypothetical protein